MLEGRPGFEHHSGHSGPTGQKNVRQKNKSRHFSVLVPKRWSKPPTVNVIKDCEASVPEWKEEIRQQLVSLKLEPAREAEIVSDVARLIIGQGMKLALLGVATGLIVALWLTDLLTHLLFEVNATDPVTFIGVPLVLAGVAFLACYLPARKASRIDPLIALRHN
jgi:hypothetical protein